MKKIKKTPLAAAVGTAIVSTFSATAAQAEANPFGMTELSEGYMQLAEADKAGEMKCGESMGMKEGTCGEGKCAGMMGDVKVKEGKCAGNKSKAAAADKSKEGKCGEGKCASMMEDGKMKKGMEGQCGEMMKGKEGACGMGAAKVDKSKEGKCGEGKCAGMMEGGKMKKGMEGQCGEMMKGKEGACGMGKDEAGAKKGSWPITGVKEGQ